MARVTPERQRSLAAALRLEYLTVGWNTVEAVVALAAGLAAGSQALIGFGGDSVIESLSGAVLIWRLADLFKKQGRWTEESAQDDLSAEVS